MAETANPTGKARNAFDAMETILVRAVMERRPSDHPWLDHVWRCVEVTRAATGDGGHEVLIRDDSVLRVLTAPVELGLHRKETGGYMLNLAQDLPRVFIALREAEAEDGELELVPFKATVCPFEAEAYTEEGAENVDAAPMPEAIRQWVSAFTGENHQEEKFIKRKRGPKKATRDPFGRRPLVDREEQGNG